MLVVTIVNDRALIKVKSPGFEESLRAIKGIDEGDRVFSKGIWTVQNLHRYRYITAIDNAIRDFEHQLEFNFECRAS